MNPEWRNDPYGHGNGCKSQSDGQARTTREILHPGAGEAGCAKGIPEDLDAILKGSANIWFTEERNLEVTVLIDAQVSHYFKRRKMFPTQEIREERPDGSLVVSFRMGQYEAIQNILKSWIPHIVILEPEEFKKDFLQDVSKWVRKQGKL
jgi:predicted DNA-binding transcriptional regulator YafY